MKSFTVSYQVHLPLVVSLPTHARPSVGDCVLLEDMYSNPVANLLLEQVLADNPDGTSSRYRLGGRISRYRDSRFRNSSFLLVTPADLAPHVPKNIIVVQSIFPPTEKLIANLIDILRTRNGMILIQAIIRPNKRHQIPVDVVHRAYAAEISQGQLMSFEDRIVISSLRISEQVDEQNRLIFQHSVARNYGATELVIHEDVCDVGYHKWPLKTTCWQESLISGDLKELITLGERIKSDRVPGHVSHILNRAYPALRERGLVVLISGRSGAGKTSLAIALRDMIDERTITHLDGDAMRRMFSRELGFSEDDRALHIRRMIHVALEIARHKGVVLVSTMAPLRAHREEFRASTERDGQINFAHIHLRSTFEECARIDPKGLYARSAVERMEGIEGRFEEPKEDEADYIVEQSHRSISLKYSAEKVLGFLKTEGFI